MRRRAYHAGSWYPADAASLGAELETYLEAAGDTSRASGQLKALVSPHAGYRYCGPTGAWGFGRIRTNKSWIRRIFVLGPSHHVALDQCALPPSGCRAYETPFGQIDLDTHVLQELRQSGTFVEFSMRQDEEEHSIEMQLPFAKYAMGDQPFVLVPIVVGSLSPDIETQYSRILAPYFDSPDTIFIISSDFCHWGDRFGYTRLLHEPSCCTPKLPPPVYPADRFPINGGIEALDRRGMDLITTQDLRAFHSYLSSHRNTICGRHPICVFLAMLQFSSVKCDINFAHYSQSQEMPNDPRPNDSCVSYAAGIAVAA